MRKCATALYELLDRDDTIVAAWRDLVGGCQNSNHIEYPYDRIAFLRDNVIALQEHRRQDPGHWGPIRTAVEVQFDNRHSVRKVQIRVGDAPISFDLRNQEEPTGLTPDQLMSLAERSIILRPNTKDVVVWLRIANAFIPPLDCLPYGDVTFYAAEVLASAIIDHDVARKMFSVIPEELLTDEISALQASKDGIDNHYGIEHRPEMVCARILLHDMEPHRAAAEARMYLDNVLAVVHPYQNMWTVLKGELVFARRRHYRPLAWGLKTDREPTMFFENDDVGEALRTLQADGHQITRKTARRLQPVIQLSNALMSIPRSDPEGIVMADVRAIEHCNSWTTQGRKSWTEYINSYLLDEFTRIAFLDRASQHIFEAVVRSVPDRSPEAEQSAELQEINDEVSEGSWDRWNLEIAFKHIAALQKIYADHPLARPLSELDDILQSGRSIGDAIDVEWERVRARVARLTRSRNAAIHGGPLSAAASDPSPTSPSTWPIKYFTVQFGRSSGASRLSTTCVQTVTTTNEESTHSGELAINVTS